CRFARSLKPVEHRGFGPVGAILTTVGSGAPGGASDRVNGSFKLSHAAVWQPPRRQGRKFFMFDSLHAQPGGKVRGRLRVPGDKSISHRSIMLGALAQGTTSVSGFLEGADAVATANIFRSLGVRIEGPRGGEVAI